MIRGTTPTLTFGIPFDITGMTKLNVALTQRCGGKDTVIIEKALSDCTIASDGRHFSFKLSETETLKLDSKKREVEMQIRLELDGEKMASNIMTTKVGKILKEGNL